jgi:hypothetical protein
LIRARLSSGEIIPLERDCDCVIHEGPHWLHMDDVDKRLNAPLRERAMRGEPLAIKAYAEAELRRLGAKRFEVERQNIDEILRG